MYPGESHPEIEALEAALAAQGVTFADVATVTAYFGPDGQGGRSRDSASPVGMRPSLQDAIVAAYLIGLGELERTERDVGDHSVTFLSEGPLDAAAYPFAVLPDAGVLWILTAEMTQILDALEATPGGRRGHGTRQHGDRAASAGRDRAGDLVRHDGPDPHLDQGKVRR